MRVVIFVVMMIEWGLVMSSDLNMDLIAACAEGKNNVYEILGLIEKGANANWKTSEGESVLHLACIWGGAERIRILLNAGADPNYRASKVPSSLDMTPLSWCVYAGYHDAVRSLFFTHSIEKNNFLCTMCRYANS